MVGRDVEDSVFNSGVLVSELTGFVVASVVNTLVVGLEVVVTVVVTGRLILSVPNSLHVQ